jgi:predicted Zn finger-like uncharacterized protein
MAVLECPECGARFAVRAGALGAGRRVKCGACGHTWFAQGAGDSGAPPIPKGIRPRPAAAPKPAAPPKKPGRVAALAVAVVAFVCVAGALLAARGPVVAAWPGAGAAYALVGAGGAAPAQGLEFDRVRAVAAGGVLTVEGRILNLAPEGRALPPVEVVVGDTAHPVLFKTNTIPAEGTAPFASEIPAGPLPPDPSITVRFVF